MGIRHSDYSLYSNTRHLMVHAILVQVTNMVFVTYKLQSIALLQI